MRRAGPLDAAFFGLEAPGHPLHAMAVMVLDPATVPGGYSFARMRGFIARRVNGIPPLHQRSVPMPMGLARPGWVDSDIDIRDHVVKRVLAGATLSDVASYAAGYAPKPLDRTKPLWAMHVIEGLEDGRIAIVAKVHHSLMDGVAGMDFLASMFSLRPKPGPVLTTAGVITEQTPNAVTQLTLAASEVLTTPIRVARALVDTGQAACRLTALASRQGSLSFPRPPRMRWNGALGARRTVALTPLSLAEVKDVSHATGGTVNDVVLSVLGGACRAYLDKHGELPVEPLVAVVPVSIHETAPNRRGHTTAVGNGAGTGRSERQRLSSSKAANALSLTLSTLGTDVADPIDRLVVVHEGMRRAKRLHESLGPNLLTRWLAITNPLVLGAAARIYLGLRVVSHAPLAANILVSDVPGPPVPLYFGGARLLGLYPLGPVYDGFGVNVTVVSCEDTLGFGLVSSPDVLDDIDALAQSIEEEFASLRQACQAHPDTIAHRTVSARP